MNCLFVGAGAVARKYAQDLADSPLNLAAVCDLSEQAATQFATTHGIEAYTDLASMLANESAPLVVNLTSHAAHAPVTEQCLRADRHVFSEKPLALHAERAANLVSIAEDHRLGLDCAPTTHRAAAQRHVRSLLGDGRLGEVGIGYAHAHVGRVTSWHENPESFLDVGPLYDGAVYPITLLVTLFGPVSRIRVADAIESWPKREADAPSGPTHYEATIEFDAGTAVRLTASLYTPHRAREFNSLELHGDDGSLYLADTGALVTDRETISTAGEGRPYTAAPDPHPPRRYSYLDGPERLADAIERGRRSYTGARRAIHVVAVCNAIETAADTGQSVELSAYGVEYDPPTVPPVRPTSATASARPATIRLPSVGLGCSRYRDGEYVDRIDSIATGLDAGYRLLDSAELYGNEVRIGNLLATPGSPDREGLFLLSKVWNTNHGHVTEACQGTLNALGIEALDCYLLHWPSAWAYQGPLRDLATKSVAEQEALTFPEEDDGTPQTVDVPLSETWKRMESLVDQGFTRTLGICNVSIKELAPIVETARIRPRIVQVGIDPSTPRTQLVRYCHERGIRVLAHSPLSGVDLETNATLHDIAAVHDVSPAGVVLAWNVARGVVPIPASVDTGHLVENIAAARIRLSASERRRITALGE
ncbi:aldo/keto reductase [Halococcus sp. IIIV-5B]|uniref:aldo/keto reductase n=1 Tax=Halococcus sp. IIIV-5B TaxID=2321230 RepID=UPI000E7671F1|nr:aldo/keto reductase [Halococcus sp. IIIV-5B]RJT07135.1 alcohol dehydrogenase [Halococcus sp. IIIV-5B]